MHGCGSKDWDRFHRRMRAFGRAMERDMRKMGEDIGRDAAAKNPDATWRWDWNWDEPERAERHAERAERHAERFADRAERRAERRAKRCAPGGFWAYWWVIFPLFFIGKNAFEDAGGFAGVGTGIGNAWGGLLQLSFVAPLADLLAGAIGLSFEQTYGLLALSAVVCAGAAVVGWRMGRPTTISPAR
jgi:hypothetical protein